MQVPLIKEWLLLYVPMKKIALADIIVWLDDVHNEQTLENLVCLVRARQIRVRHIDETGF